MSGCAGCEGAGVLSVRERVCAECECAGCEASGCAKCEGAGLLNVREWVYLM